VVQVAAYNTDTGKFTATSPSASSSSKQKETGAPPEQRPAVTGGVKRDAQGRALCMWCGLPRDNHPKKNFGYCKKKPTVVERTNTQQQSGGSSSKAEGKGNKGKKGKQVEIPSHMTGTRVARREPPNMDHPEGRRFCFEYHTEGRRCERAGCIHSHRCPVFKDDGSICLGGHPVHRHGQ